MDQEFSDLPGRRAKGPIHCQHPGVAGPVPCQVTAQTRQRLHVHSPRVPEPPSRRRESRQLPSGPAVTVCVSRQPGSMPLESVPHLRGVPESLWSREVWAGCLLLRSLPSIVASNPPRTPAKTEVQNQRVTGPCAVPPQREVSRPSVSPPRPSPGTEAKGGRERGVGSGPPARGGGY